MKKIQLFIISMVLILMSSCESAPKKDLCKLEGCQNETAGWDNYKTNSSYSGPMKEGSFRLSEFGGSFCSQDHAIQALD